MEDAACADHANGDTGLSEQAGNTVDSMDNDSSEQAGSTVEHMDNSSSQNENPATANELYAVAATKVNESTTVQIQYTTYSYVELDTTSCRDCYSIPGNAQIIHALRTQFPTDRTRNTTPLWGRDKGRNKKHRFV